MKWNNFLIAMFFVFEALGGFVGGEVHARQAKPCTVGVPVVDAYGLMPAKPLRRLSENEPLLAHDACGLDTQILLGDRLRFVKTYQDAQGVAWSGVELLDQPTYRDGSWYPKICFIKKQQLCFGVKNWQPNARVGDMLAPVYAKPQAKSLMLGMLSMGTSVRVVDKKLHGWAKIMLAAGVFGYIAASGVIGEEYSKSWTFGTQRTAVVAAAKKFKKTPYRWGGCSGFDERSHALTGVDCSGLVCLVFRAAWLNVPRDAHDQFIAAFPIKFGKDLLPGDLVFLAKTNQEKKTVRVDHVLMVMDGNYLIESTGFGCLSREAFRALPGKVRQSAGVRVVSPAQHARLGKPLAELWHGQVGPEGDLIFLGTFLGDQKTRKMLIKGLIS